MEEFRKPMSLMQLPLFSFSKRSDKRLETEIDSASILAITSGNSLPGAMANDVLSALLSYKQAEKKSFVLTEVAHDLGYSDPNSSTHLIKTALFSLTETEYVTRDWQKGWESFKVISSVKEIGKGRSSKYEFELHKTILAELEKEYKVLSFAEYLSYPQGLTRRLWEFLKKKEGQFENKAFTISWERLCKWMPITAKQPAGRLRTLRKAIAPLVESGYVQLEERGEIWAITWGKANSKPLDFDGFKPKPVAAAEIKTDKEQPSTDLPACLEVVQYTEIRPQTDTLQAAKQADQADHVRELTAMVEKLSQQVAQISMQLSLKDQEVKELTLRLAMSPESSQKKEIRQAEKPVETKTELPLPENVPIVQPQKQIALAPKYAGESAQEPQKISQIAREQKFYGDKLDERRGTVGAVLNSAFPIPPERYKAVEPTYAEQKEREYPADKFPLFTWEQAEKWARDWFGDLGEGLKLSQCANSLKGAKGNLESFLRYFSTVFRKQFDRAKQQEGVDGAKVADIPAEKRLKLLKIAANKLTHLEPYKANKIDEAKAAAELQEQRRQAEQADCVKRLSEAAKRKADLESKSAEFLAAFQQRHGELDADEVVAEAVELAKKQLSSFWVTPQDRADIRKRKEDVCKARVKAVTQQVCAAKLGFGELSCATAAVDAVWAEIGARAQVAITGGVV